MSEPSHNPALHRLAILTALATFPLIFMGGVVTTKGAGMSVPDWPNSYGYNMFLFPPSQWVGGVLYEHTHRLMGTVVGFLSVLLVLFAWGPARNPSTRKRLLIATVLSGLAAFVLLLILLVIKASKATHVDEVFARTSHIFVGMLSLALILGACSLARRREPRRWVRWLCTAVLIAVCFQGLLGGLRVVMVELKLAVVHACFAQAFFCLVALVVLATSRRWNQLIDHRTSAPSKPSSGRPATGEPSAAAAPPFRGFARLAVAGVVVVLLQLIIGATMRHYDAGLAIPDLPLHYGKLIPPTDAASLAEANLARANSGSPDLRPVTLLQVWLHMGHRLGAVLVTVVLGAIIWRSLREPQLRLPARTPALLLSVLLAAQLTLGVLTVLWHKPADIASLHVAVGALALVTAFTLAARVLVWNQDPGHPTRFQVTRVADLGQDDLARQPA